MLPAQPSPAKAAELQVRKILFHFVGELRNEAGPFVPAVETLATMGRGHVQKMWDSIGKGHSPRGRLKVLGACADRYERDVVEPLETAAGRALDEKAAKDLIADRCSILQNLIDDFRQNFPVSPPKSVARRPVSPIVERTAVAFDLSRYSEKIRARTTTNPAGEHSREALQDIVPINSAIHAHIDAALDAAKIGIPDRTFVSVQGDGGIIEFEEISDAFSFAEHLHQVARAFNADSDSRASSQDEKSRELREYHYRVTASHGWVTVNPDVYVHNNPELWRVGLSYFEVARLLSDAPIGGIRTTQRTHNRLCEEIGTEDPLARGYSEAHSVVVKHAEIFIVRDKIVAIVP